MNFKSTVSALCLILGGLPLLAGGPWAQPKHEGYYQLSYTFIPEYNSLYQTNGRTALLSNDIMDRTLAAYGEFGIAKNLTLLGEIPFKILSSKPVESLGNGGVEELSRSALGNTVIGAKWQLTSNFPVIAAQVKLGMPAPQQDDSIAVRLRSGFERTSILPSVAIGQGADRYYWYVDVGMRFKGDESRNHLFVNAEAGAKFLDQLWVIGVVDILGQSLTRVDGVDTDRETGLYPLDQAYTAYGIKLIWDAAEHWGLNFARFGANSGHLVAKSPTTTLGVFFRH